MHFKNNASSAQLIIIAWKLKTPGNMGQIIRIAHNVGAIKIYFIDNGRNKRDSEIKKTAGFSFEQMDWELIEEEKFKQVIPEGFSLIAVETSEGAKNIYSVDLPQKTALVVGSESNGIPSEVIQKCNQSIYIPMPGGCKSLNVSHAVSVAAFEWLRQTAFALTK